MKAIVLGMLFPLATLNTGNSDRTTTSVLNDVMPGLITLAVVAAWLALIVLGRPDNVDLTDIVRIVIAFYFGQHVAMAAARGILSSTATATQAATAAATAASTAQAAAVQAATNGGKP